MPGSGTPLSCREVFSGGTACGQNFHESGWSGAEWFLKVHLAIQFAINWGRIRGLAQRPACGKTKDHQPVINDDNG